MELPAISVSPEQSPLDFGGDLKSGILRIRERTGQPIWVASSADDTVRSLVSQLSSPHASHTSIRACLGVLLNEVAPFKRQSQETMRDAGGIEALATLLHDGLQVESSAQQASDERKHLQQDVMLYTLYVLHALSSTDEMLMPIALQPGCLTSMISYLGSSNTTKIGLQLAVAATNVLVNLTYSGSSAIVQQAVLQAGTLDAVVALLMRPAAVPEQGQDENIMQKLTAATIKNAVWLVDHLTAAHGSLARVAVVSHQPVLQRLVDLVSSKEAGASLFACDVICNVARCGCEAQEAFAGIGAITKLASLLQPDARTPNIVAAAMMALSALSVNHNSNARSIRMLPGLLTALESQLAVRCDIYTCNNDDAQFVVAMHTLVHTLGHNAASADPPAYNQLYGPDARSLQAKMSGEERALPGIISTREQHLIDSKYMSLGQAATLLGIKLSLSSFNPASPASSLPHEGLTRNEADALATSDMVRAQRALHLAEVSHRVHENYLPRMRSDNARLAANALANLYHLSVAEAHDVEVHRMMCNTALLLQLKAILARGALPTSQSSTTSPMQKESTESALPATESPVDTSVVRCDSRLLQTALSVTASLALFPECNPHMAELKMLTEVVALAEHADPLVRLCGERALMAMYLTTTTAAAVAASEL